MSRIKPALKKSRYLLGLFLILFSLAPCAVKDIFANSLSATYQATFNKTKTTLSANNCSVSFSTTQQHVVEQKSIKKRCSAVGKGNEKIITISANFTAGFTEKCSCNSPPQYILYKRLKIAMA